MHIKLIGLVGAWLIPCLMVNAETFDRIIDSPMYRVPEQPLPREEFVFPKGAKALWLRALERPEADMKCKAAHAIATAHRLGVAGFETTIPALRTVLDRPDQHPSVRLAVAEALIALDARQASASLLRQTQSGDSDLRELIEPALARWDHAPARADWLSRLGNPATPSRNLTLAIRCLADVREEKAVEPLRALVLSERVAGPQRLQAARALAALRSAGLEKDAERLSADGSRRGLTARLAAAALLRQHRGAESVALMQRLARDPEPAVAAPAVARLLEIDPALLDAWLDYLLAGPEVDARRDANLRLLAVEALRRRPSEKHLRLLNARLDDEHSGVRVAARDYLAELAADKKWREQILQDATALLETDGWRGQEQATILVTQFDHKPAADRLVKLLTSERAEVAITAAWALRKLAVADSLPGIVKHIESRLKPLVSGRGPSDPTQTLVFLVNNHQLSQLNQLLGQQKYRPAEPLLRRFVPRPMVPAPSAEARAAAIHALSLIHEDRAPDDLVTAVEARLNDSTSLPPEDPRVRWMSALALGRWKAKKTVPSLRKYYPDRKPSPDVVNNACGWALWQITGEAVPPADLAHSTAHDWFLIPQGK